MQEGERDEQQDEEKPSGMICVGYPLTIRKGGGRDQVMIIAFDIIIAKGFGSSS